MAFAKLSLVGIFKAKLSTTFSGRVLLRACSTDVAEEIIFKIQEYFGDFCTGETFLDVLLSGRAKLEALWGLSSCDKGGLTRNMMSCFRGLLWRLSQVVL